MHGILTFLLDLIFPPSCVGCDKLGTLLCERCYEKINFNSFAIKPETDSSALNSLTAMASYDGVIRSAITLLKFHSVHDIGKVLGTMLYETTAFPTVDYITSVPLHRKRQQQRGFNQASVITQALAACVQKPYVPMLHRQRFTTAQSKTTAREQRLSQLHHVFAARESAQKYAHNFIGKRVLIIDDVVTTGATLNECAIVLKTLGFQEVHGLAVAHGGG